MTKEYNGTTYSDDGQYWWDGYNWQPVQAAAVAVQEPAPEYKVNKLNLLKGSKGIKQVMEGAATAKQVNNGQQVIVKTYKNAKEYEKDAKKMGVAGYFPQGQVAGQKRNILGGMMIGGGASHKVGNITVTWVKQ